MKPEDQVRIVVDGDRTMVVCVAAGVEREFLETRVLHSLGESWKVKGPSHECQFDYARVHYLMEQQR